MLTDKEKEENAEKRYEEMFKEAENASLIGSGDDMFFVMQIREYKKLADKQKKFWIDYIQKVITDTEQSCDAKWKAKVEENLIFLTNSIYNLFDSDEDTLSIINGEVNE